MKLLKIQLSLWVITCYNFNAHATNLEPAAAGWTNLITSKNYSNTKLVLESGIPFKRQYFSKEWYSEGTARMLCGKICASNAKCQAFNMYPTASYYVCESLHENFCFPRQRLALQAWPGGTVWDKLQPGMTRACIDQKFGNQTNMTNCDIGRFGCRSTWPNCDTCVKTCNDCSTTYSLTGPYNCTLWPEDVFRPPIFAFCRGKTTFLIKRPIYFNKHAGSYYVGSTNYLMSFPDMHRLWKLQVYNTLDFSFNATDKTQYVATYQNFVIDSRGTLMNMTYKSGNVHGNDGFKLGNNPLKPSPWVTRNSKSNCGSFWLLNSTQAAGTKDCPGGKVNMFGEVGHRNKTGIRWPNATDAGKTLIYTDTKMNL